MRLFVTGTIVMDTIRQIGDVFLIEGWERPAHSESKLSLGVSLPGNWGWKGETDRETNRVWV